MGKWGEVILRTLKIIKVKKDIPIIEAWKKSALEIFGQASKSRKRGCPRAAFLGLCEEGLIKGFPPGNYTNAIKNKEYALKAVELLKKEHHGINSAETLSIVLKDHLNLKKRLNAQMDVIYTLWENGYLNYHQLKQMDS